MKITDITCHVLLDPSFEVGATSSAQDDFVVEIHTDNGITGIGETDANPWMVRACVEAPGTHTMGQSLRTMLIGRDPLDIEDIWDQLYTGSAMNGRRGLVINAIGAIDMALHDLRGKALGKPCHEFLGLSPASSVVPYASLLPEVSSFDRYARSLVAWSARARSLGFNAVKLELILGGPYAHMGIQEPWERSTEVIAAVREAVGSDFTLMVDVAYGFPDADTCLQIIKEWIPYDLFFVETPLPADDLKGLARVSQEQPIPIASGEWLTTRFEFEELMDLAHVQVVQPDIGRVGGLTEALRVCAMAADRGLTVVPHLWNTGISVAAAVHLAAVTPQCPFIEYLSPELSESALRKRLTSSGPEMSNGRVPVPTASGLGVTIDPEALREFEAAARSLAP